MAPPTKGDRIQLTVRLPREIVETIRAESRKTHVPAGDMVVHMVLKQMGRTDLSPISEANESALETQLAILMEGSPDTSAA